jgi:hypothetical protein
MVGDMGSTRAQVLGLPKKQKIEKTARSRCAEFIRKRDSEDSAESRIVG